MKTKLTALAGIAIMSLVLVACNPGQRLGNFKNYCTEQKGELLKSDKNPTDYMCKLPDGKVVYSK